MATKLSKARPAKVPDGLLTAGRSLWKSVTDEYELDQHEALLLIQACRCADRLDSMARSPGRCTGADAHQLPRRLGCAPVDR